jgi:hypothetical protein
MKTLTRYVILTAIAAAWAWGAAYSEQPYADCEGDTDCEQQCIESLQPDEDESICEVQA